ncbi:Nramp family divalent metal transporter [Streptomyces sp. NPDC002143]
MSVTSATKVLPRFRRPRAGAALLGPAFVAAIAYVDPGNVATNSAAGAKYGHLLLWVIVVANMMAMLVQYLSAKLGTVTGASLPEHLRERLSRPARMAYWAQAELVSMATDLAEVLGGALALYILFDLPLMVGGLVTGVVSMVVLHLTDRRGPRPFERIMASSLLVIAVGFGAGLLFSPPAASGVLGGLVPRFADSESLLLAAGIVGATVMPHAVYLHSALARDRFSVPSGGHRPLLARIRRDVITAMVLAGAVNMAMLSLAATALPGSSTAHSIEGVHDGLDSTLGGSVALLFAVALLVSGIASTSVGCYAGAVVMEGLLRRRVPILVRRAVTLVPAFTLLAIGADPTRTLVISQVVLSLCIPFALVPVVLLTARTDVMGTVAVNRRITTVMATLIVLTVITLNLALLYLTFT